MELSRWIPALVPLLLGGLLACGTSGSVQRGTLGTTSGTAAGTTGASTASTSGSTTASLTSGSSSVGTTGGTSSGATITSASSATSTAAGTTHGAASSGTTGASASTSATSTSSTTGSASARFAVDLVEEEVVGPFSSWANVQTGYGAKGDGVTDDTAAFQSALSDLGPKTQMLYVPAGTYKISATLHLQGSPSSGASDFGWGGVGLIGDDPSTTTLTWAGPAGEPMLIQNGGVGTRYSRLTWDGAGVAGYGVAQWWNDLDGGILYGGSTEHQDEVFQNLSIGIMAGRLGPSYGNLDSEGQVRRVTFKNDSYAGLDVGSYNALDWWVWDSSFVNCARGVSNQYSLDLDSVTQFTLNPDAGFTSGAGAVYVYRSLFQGSTVADMAIANTEWFSMHENVSIGSKQFFQADPLGNNPANVVLEGNRVVQGTDPVPISLGNTGPLMIVDNQIQAGSTTYNLTDFISTEQVLSVGNQETVGSPIDAGSQWLVSVDDTSVAASSLSTQPLTLPPTPGWTSHQVYEVAAGSTAAQIQTVLAQAFQSTDSQPIVHFGTGHWQLNAPLQIPVDSRVQLVGDGFESVFEWSGAADAGPFLSIAAPSKVTVRDLQWIGETTNAIEISNADQPGGRIQTVSSEPGAVTASNLEQTQLSFQANPGINSITFDDVHSAVAISNGGIGPVSLTGGSTFLMADTWYEGDATTLFTLTDGTFTYLGGHLAPATHDCSSQTLSTPPAIVLNDFAGTAAWLCAQIDLSCIPSHVGIQIQGEVPQTTATFLGIAGNEANYFQRASGDAGVGNVGFIFNRTAGNAQAPDQGSDGPTDIANAWTQARSLIWDSTPYQVPTGSTDVRLYHVKMTQTGGLVVNGK